MQAKNTPTSEKTPKVSVCVVTYNQEKYIRQCLQSILDQETDFDFEVLVADDCSTDGTRAIIEEFAQKYPEIVKPVFHEENIGPYNNFVFIHEHARGEYIAHVDGDDYCLPGKLKKQVELLDCDDSCNIVFHRMQLLKTSGDLIEDRYLNMPNIGELRLDRQALLRFVTVGGHSSKMYRKKFRDYEFPNFPVIDYFTDIEQVRDGYARFVGHESLGVYRVGIGVAYSGFGVRKALAESMVFFFAKYPQYRLQINTAALTYFLANLNGPTKGWLIFLRVWLRTFHPLSIFNLFFRLKYIMVLKGMFNNLKHDLEEVADNDSIATKIKCISTSIELFVKSFIRK